jgi:hypothetical protein
MIAIGIYFLLYNLGVVSGLNWVGALQLWPLLLIFIGVNVIVRQAPGGIGTLLSGLVSLTAVAAFGYVLLFPDDNTILNKFATNTHMEVMREAIEFAPEETVREAKVLLDLDAVDGEVFALANGRNLIQGNVAYVGNLIFDHTVSGDQAEITLDARNDRFPFFWLGNGSFGFTDEDNWQVGLSPEAELDLTVDAGSGDLMLDLAGLTLSDLDIDTGSGRTEMFLPGGEFDVVFDAGSGSTEMTLAGDGRYTIHYEAGSGNLTIYLPPTMAAHIDFEAGSGRLHVDDRFEQVSGDESNGVWQTAGWGTADTLADFTIDMGSGSVTIETVGGR